MAIESQEAPIKAGTAPPSGWEDISQVMEGGRLCERLTVCELENHQRLDGLPPGKLT